MLLAGSITTSFTTSADQAALKYLYEPELGERHSLLLDRIHAHARNGEFDYAMSLSSRLLDGLPEGDSIDRNTLGQLVVNDGIILVAAEHYEDGLVQITQGLDLMEQRTSPFSSSLINAIMAKGITEFALDNLETALDTYRRAQHITHRQGGVYTEEQLPIVDHLTSTHLRQGKIGSADQQQRFALRVAEQTYGPNSIELVPMLTRLGSYFATRGSTYPVSLDLSSNEARMFRSELFDDAVAFFERAITIVEQTHGRNDVRLVEALRGLARARMLQRTNTTLAEEALERSLAIVESNPDSDLTDRANAMIALGDLYIITGDTRAAETYLVAWHLLQENESTRQLASRLFGTPTRVAPAQRSVRTLHRQPDNTDPGDPLYVSLEYSVTVEGRVQNVKVIDKNVPNDKVRNMREDIRRTRFRPRIKEGEILPTDGLVLYQPFQVARRTSQAELVSDEEDTDAIEYEADEIGDEI